MKLDERRTLLPVRHLSPACAHRVVEALDALAPDEVLVEGPSDFRDLDALTDPALEAPVALFAHVSTPSDDATGARVRHVGWYPFTDYAPELAALRWAARRGARARFADIPSHARVRRGPGDVGVATEPYRRALGAARARDLDELWDALFEVPRQEPWDAFFARAARYGAWLRGLIPSDRRRSWNDRERFMAAALRRADGRAVLVCGASHAAGVDEAFSAKAKAPRFRAPSRAHRGLHLTAHGFAQLAALGGADEAPAFHQRCFEDPRGWLTALTDAAHAAREAELPVSTADLAAAAELAVRLARFRDRPGPTRADVRDAIRSAWTKGALDETRDPRAIADAVFVGTRIGRLPRATDPPLVADVRARLRSARFPHEPDARRTARLRPMRAERDRARAELLQRLVYLEVPYAEQEAGPRYLDGRDLDRVEQRWALSWTAETDRVLVERASLGPSLREAVVQHLRERVRSSPPSAQAASRRVLEACALGLHDLLEGLLDRVGARIDAEPRLAGVLAALHDLWLLHAHRDALGAVGLPALAPYLARAWSRALSLLGDLPHTPAEGEAEALDGLRTLALVSERGPGPIDPDVLHDELARLVDALRGAPGVHLAARTLGWVAGRRAVDEVIDALGAHLWEADRAPDAPGRAFDGLFAFARRVYVDHPRLLGGVALRLRALPRERFLCALPELRRAHATLTPWETASLAAEIARRYGGAPVAVAHHTSAPRAAPADAAPVASAGEPRGAAGPDAPPDAIAEPALPRLAAAVERELWRFGFGIDAPTTSPDAPAAPEPPRAPRDEEMLLRWRLVLGRFAEERVPLSPDGPAPPLPGAAAGAAGADPAGFAAGTDACRAAEGGDPSAPSGSSDRAAANADVRDLDRVLGFLYDREYREGDRGVREGGTGPSQLTVPRWIGEVHRLFPRAVVERVEQTALDRYGLTELVTDPEVLARLEPSVRLLDAVLRLKDRMDGRVLTVARAVVRRVAERIERRLRLEVDLAFGRSRGAVRHAPRGPHRDFAPARTIARNLRGWDPKRRRLIIERPWFARPREHRRWRVIVCVDQSGSMLDSLVHASVIASVFQRVGKLDPRLVTFDTEVVDLSDHLDDPVQTLMGVQLGGGTDIARAIAYASQLVSEPRRTLIVLISDLYEGRDPAEVEARVGALLSDGAKVLVLPSLDDREGTPTHDRQMARRLARRGARVATPNPEALVRAVAELVR